MGGTERDQSAQGGVDKGTGAEEGKAGNMGRGDNNGGSVRQRYALGPTVDNYKATRESDGCKEGSGYTQSGGGTGATRTVPDLTRTTSHGIRPNIER